MFSNSFCRRPDLVACGPLIGSAASERRYATIWAPEDRIDSPAACQCLNAVQHRCDQIVIGGGAAEAAVEQVDARNKIALGPVAVGAIDAVELLAAMSSGL